MHMRLVIAGVAAAVLAACATQEETTVTAKAINPDTHLYLEEVEGEQALAWVRGEMSGRWACWRRTRGSRVIMMRR